MAITFDFPMLRSRRRAVIGNSASAIMQRGIGAADYFNRRASDSFQLARIWNARRVAVSAEC